MKARIGIVAALPRELKPLIRDWPVRIASRHKGTLVAENDRAIATCAGMGGERVAEAIALAESRGPLSAIVSVGYAGALRDETLRNAVWWPGAVIDAETGKRYTCEGGSGVLVTTRHVIGREAKPQLAAQFAADLVDMEAATIACWAQQRGLPFRTLKVVSDEVKDVLLDFNRFIDARGGFREAAFGGFIALHPWLIPSAIRLGRSSERASQTIALALRELLEHA
jgi:adenosylhomocysteine nucleosidase